MKLKPLPGTFCPKRFTFGLIIELQSYFLVINPSFQHQFKRTRLRKPQIRKAWSIMTRASLTFWYCLKRSVVTVVTRVQHKNVSTRIVVQYVMCHKLQKMILISLPICEFKKKKLSLDSWSVEPPLQTLDKETIDTNKFTYELFYCVAWRSSSSHLFVQSQSKLNWNNR